jgi:chemotaxis protein MotA
MSNISFGTIFGILGGFGLFITAIVTNTDNYLMFISLGSMLIVVGGTFAATMTSYQGRYVMKALKGLTKIIIPSTISPESLYQDVKQVIQWSKVAAKDGMPGLERKFAASSKSMSEFLKYCTELVVTGYKGDELRNILETAVETMFQRNMIPSRILNTMASIAPAFGMVGTLVGLIIMLDNMGADPSKIGGGLAIALITTLYGVLLAQLVLKPASRKLQQKEEMMRFRNDLLVEGFVLLVEQKRAINMQDHLNSFLDPKFHFQIVTKEDKAKFK